MMIPTLLLAATLANAHPKITMKEARTTALHKAAGTVKSEELENEKGKLIYSFDIATKSGIVEVNVDAMTGKILEAKPETAAQEKAEKAKEAKEKRDGSKH